jgi:hypothetical protein
MRERWTTLAVASACVAVACASCVGSRGSATAPGAIVIGRAPGAASGAHDTTSPSSPDTDAPAPVGLAIAHDRVCARIGGRIHCTRDLGPDFALGAAPALDGIEDAVDLALGRRFGCAVTRAGAVLCFGDNQHGQLGAGLRAERSDTPVVVLGVTGARRVAAGETHACALLGDGTVRCWGNNDRGQTGGGARYLPAARELVRAENVPGVKGAVELAASASTTCALDDARALTCWGQRVRAAEGPALATSQADTTLPVVVAELARLDDVSAADGAFCGTRAGEVLCWGETWSLVAGARASAKHVVPVGVTGARRISVARSHACAVLASGAITCWGTNGGGALGRGETTGSGPQVPAEVNGLPPSNDVVVGGAMACAITRTADIYCWGSFPRSGHQQSTKQSPIRLRIAD